MSLLNEIMELEPNHLWEAPATEQALTEFRTSLGDNAPHLLLELLKRSNGGEFSFLRFEPSPFLPMSGTDIWTHVQNFYPPSPLIESREFLPLGNDYGDALICLCLRTQPASVFLVPFYSRSEDEFELLAPDFEVFLAQSLEFLRLESKRKTVTVQIALDQGQSQSELESYGVRFERVDPALIIADEKNASFPNEMVVEYLARPECCLCYTFRELEDSGTKDYGVVNARNELKPGQVRRVYGQAPYLAIDFRYLQESGTYRSYPVWTLVSEEPWRQDSCLQVELEFLS